VTAGASASTALGRTIELQRVGCELAGSDLYARVLAAVARDVDDGGPCRQVLEPYAEAPVGDAILLRLLAGVHSLVLDGTLEELAGHYPSVGGTPGPDLGAAFVRAVGAHVPGLASVMDSGVQTNEPGRSVALLCGFLAEHRPGLQIRVLEIGASAGLNLLFDHYHYRSAGWSFGPPDSQLRFDDPWVGRPPAARGPIEVVERRGCDVDPIDPSSPAGVQRLRSFVWPDQLPRLARLDAALAVAAAHPVEIDRAHAVGWLRERLAEPPPGVVTVVSHSIMFQYLSQPDRSELLDLLERAGARATAATPLVWLRMEPGGEQAEVRTTSWPGGRTRLVARSSYHGPPVASLL